MFAENEAYIYLFADGFHIVRMCVTDGDNGMSSIGHYRFLIILAPFQVLH